MSIQNLFHTEAIKKLNDLADGKIAMLSTFIENKMETRPMMTQKIDDQGNVFFMTKDSSDLVDQILLNDDIDLIYTNHSESSYLHLKGDAILFRDQAVIDEIWSDFAKAWFEGKTDPTIRLIKFHPQEGRYWDSESGRMIQMVKIFASALTGNQYDAGREGDLTF